MLKIRKAQADDLLGVQRIIKEAYSPYVARIGREPAPLNDDYARRISAGEVEVVDGSDGLEAVLVLVCEKEALLLDNIAVANSARGKGLGGALLDHTEATARALGYSTVRLYTHELMTENLAIYSKRGYLETHRSEQNGMRRVFMTKPLRPHEAS